MQAFKISRLLAEARAHLGALIQIMEMKRKTIVREGITTELGRKSFPIRGVVGCN